MAELTVEKDFRAKVCEKVQVASEGIDRYRVFTPFMFEGGGDRLRRAF